MRKKNADRAPKGTDPGTKKTMPNASNVTDRHADSDKLPPGKPSIGSAAAFEATEATRDDEDSDEDNDDMALLHGH